jgi:hypothetical protein
VSIVSSNLSHAVTGKEERKESGMNPTASEVREYWANTFDMQLRKAGLQREKV